MLNRILFFCCVFAFGFSLNAQGPDKEKKSIRIPAVKAKKEKDSTPLLSKVAPKKNPKADRDKAKTAGDAKDKKKYIIKESERPFSMVYDDGLRSSGEIFEERWNKEAQKLGIRRVMSDQFLGEHKIDSKFVNIVCRDHGQADGDRVSVTVNDDLIYRNVLLTNSYRRLKIDLTEGRNQIDIKALNQGSLGPNTAEFIVYDDKGQIVSSKEWELLTGVKATIVFINEKVTITRKTAGNE